MWQVLYIAHTGLSRGDFVAHLERVLTRAFSGDALHRTEVRFFQVCHSRSIPLLLFPYAVGSVPLLVSGMEPTAIDRAQEEGTLLETCSYAVSCKSARTHACVGEGVFPMHKRFGQSGGVPSSGDALAGAADIVQQIVQRRDLLSDDAWQDLIERNRIAHAERFDMQAAFYSIASSAPKESLHMEVSVRLLSDVRLSVELRRVETGGVEL